MVTIYNLFDIIDNANYIYMILLTCFVIGPSFIQVEQLQLIGGSDNES